VNTDSIKGGEFFTNSACQLVLHGGGLVGDTVYVTPREEH